MAPYRKKVRLAVYRCTLNRKINHKSHICHRIFARSLESIQEKNKYLEKKCEQTKADLGTLRQQVTVLKQHKIQMQIVSAHDDHRVPDVDNQ